MSISEELEQKLKAAVEEVVKQHNIAIENLTREQVVSAFMQAVRCGDFQRQVQIHSGYPPIYGQEVVYTPAREAMDLKFKLDNTRRQLQTIQDSLQEILTSL